MAEAIAHPHHLPPPRKGAELTVLLTVLFSLERRVAWGPGQGLAAVREGGWEGKASLTR